MIVYYVNNLLESEAFSPPSGLLRQTKNQSSIRSSINLLFSSFNLFLSSIHRFDSIPCHMLLQFGAEITVFVASLESSIPQGCIGEMYIQDLKQGETEREEEQVATDPSSGTIISSDVKKVLVLAGARALFYPTLLYNVLRNKIQSDFRWWDRVDEFILLGAVPFPAHVPCLKELGVCGVVTLNEPYETLVQSSLYNAHNIDHLVIPTRDYLFAPYYGDICQAVEFISQNASRGKTTYVHCKAGRGRSTTVVLCYLVEHKHMTPSAALDYVRSIRPRVRLAAAQWQAVQEYYVHKVKKTERTVYPQVLTLSKLDTEPFDDDRSVVLVTESDLDGYDSCKMGNDMLVEELSVACRVQFASQAAIARLSCLWVRCNVGSKMLRKKPESSSDQIGSISVDIRVY